jgi:hypothetical protein
LARRPRPRATRRLGRYVGTDGYDLTALRADLARCTFLLGQDDGEQLFGHGEK